MSRNNASTHAAVFADMREGLSLRKSCAKNGIVHSTFISWIDADKGLADQYARARAQMLDMQAELLDEIGERAASADSAVEVAGLRLLSDNRKWLLSKLASKKYGDKVIHAGDAENPVQVQLTSVANDLLAKLKSS